MKNQHSPEHSNEYDIGIGEPPPAWLILLGALLFFTTIVCIVGIVSGCILWYIVKACATVSDMFMLTMHGAEYIKTLFWYFFWGGGVLGVAGYYIWGAWAVYRHSGK